MREVVFLGAARTPIGAFGGSLIGLSATELGIVAAKEAIQRSAVAAADVDEVIIGNVLSAGQGQNIARQVGMGSGIPETSPAFTLNMVCASGLRSVSLATQIIAAGGGDIILVGGTESMSNSSYLLPKARWGARMGETPLVDSMIKDGLWDYFNDYHMGMTAENLAKKWEISREDQDQFALTSQLRAEKAITDGKFKDEIVPVVIKGKKSDVVFDTDEYPRAGSTLEGLAKLRPAFTKDGTVTAGNSSGINDGAAMLVVASREKADYLGIKPLAAVAGYGSAGVAPDIMGYGAVPAAQKALSMAGISVNELDLIEANEAFAAQSLCVRKELGLPLERTNVNGGAIALGHPIGASGARILTTLLYELKKRNGRYGLATLCVGGGQGTAVVVERS